MSKQRHLYVIYDGRANFQTTDQCSIYEAIDPEDFKKNEGKIKRYTKNHWPDGVLFKYDVTASNQITNERRIYL